MSQPRYGDVFTKTPDDLFEVMGVTGVVGYRDDDDDVKDSERGIVVAHLIGFTAEQESLTLRFVTALQARRFAAMLQEAADRSLEA